MEELNTLETLIPKGRIYALPYNIESDSNVVWDTIGKLTDEELEDAIQKEYEVDDERYKYLKELLKEEQKYRIIALDTFQQEVLSLIFKNPPKLESLFQLEDLFKKHSIDVITLKMYIKTLISQIPCNLFCIVKRLEKEAV
jgi:hypothetical protein|nr:MAG TPA: hypothetical protein [Caudoviricetes sp.]